MSDYDFRDNFEKGQTIYFVNINYLTGAKIIYKLTVGTIYKKLLIAYVNRGHAVLIGPEDIQYIFDNKQEAEECLNKIKGEK